MKPQIFFNNMTEYDIYCFSKAEIYNNKYILKTVITNLYFKIPDVCLQK